MKLRLPRLEVRFPALDGFQAILLVLLVVSVVVVGLAFRQDYLNSRLPAVGPVVEKEYKAAWTSPGSYSNNVYIPGTHFPERYKIHLENGKVINVPPVQWQDIKVGQLWEDVQ